MRRRLLSAIVILVSCLAAPVSQATDFTSLNFILRDPMISSGGSVYATSSSFQYLSSTAQLSVIGQGSSASFSENAGFLYYATATTPVVTATPGDTEVDLSWTASTGQNGFTVTEYEAGISTASGGPYTFTSTGLTTTHTFTSLTNGFDYYFVVRVLDAFGDVIATSAEVTASPGVAAPPGGGGGGGGGPAVTEGRVLAPDVLGYPNLPLKVLIDGQDAVQVTAGVDGLASVTLDALTAGTYLITFFATDAAGIRSNLFSLPVTVEAGADTTVGGVFVAPSLSLDPPSVPPGDPLTVSGTTAPASQVTVRVAGRPEYDATVTSAADGSYLTTVDTTGLATGTYEVYAQTTSLTRVSPTSSFERLKVEYERGTLPPGVWPDPDLDGRVDLTDFSILAYWYGRTLEGDMVEYERQFLSGDGKIDLTDFSILVFHWTG